MNYLKYLFVFLNLVPGIAQLIQSAHAAKSLDEKVAIAQGSIAVGVQAATAVLPPEEADDAAKAGAVASQVLSTTIAAIHNATTQPAAA